MSIMGKNNNLPGSKRNQDPDFTNCDSLDPTNACEVCGENDTCFCFADIVITEKEKEPVTIKVKQKEFKDIYLIRKVKDSSVDDLPKLVLFQENSFGLKSLNFDNHLGDICITVFSKCAKDSQNCPKANFIELDPINFNFFNGTHTQELIFYDSNKKTDNSCINLHLINSLKTLLRGGRINWLSEFFYGKFVNTYLLEIAKQHKPEYPVLYGYDKDGLYSRPDDTQVLARINILPYMGFKITFGFFHIAYRTGEFHGSVDLGKRDQQQIQTEIYRNKNPDKSQEVLHGGKKSRAQKGFNKIAPSVSNKEYEVSVDGSINVYGMELELDIEESIKTVSETFELLTKNSFLDDLAEKILGRPSPSSGKPSSQLLSFGFEPGLEVDFGAELESSPDLLDNGFSWDVSVSPMLRGWMKIDLIQGIIAGISVAGGPGSAVIYEGLTFIRDKLRNEGGGSGLQLEAYLKLTVDYKAGIKLKKSYKDDFDWTFTGDEVTFTPKLFLGVLGSIETFWASGAFLLSGRGYAELKFKLAENEESQGVELLFYHEGIMMKIQGGAIWTLGKFTEEQKANLNFEDFKKLLQSEGNVGAGVEYIIQDPIDEKDAVVLIS